jgi:hypothetical protein
VITDERMDNRAQVILIITGLGATSVDATPGARTVQQPAAIPVTAPEPAARSYAAPSAALNSTSPAAAYPIQPLASTPETTPPARSEMKSGAVDLDLPAFMRRRVR